VEFDLQPGDELFVGSAAPHQVTTLEPALALSGNYRFNHFGQLSKLQEKEIHAKAKGKEFHVDENLDDKARARLTIMKDVSDVVEDALKAKDFRRSGWTSLWSNGHRPQSRQATAVEDLDDEDIVRDVVMVISDPSLLQVQTQ